ncbi:MAG: MlaD family protein [Planctomycetota bacterium]|nr:MlaD family protein [Planctomycetota bacterium]
MTESIESSEPLPTAELRTAERRSWAWLVPVVALALAIGFLAKAWDERGVPITIHFEEGHGIKAGDSLRYRGITVGEVTEVNLARGLGGVDVHLSLDESGLDLARSGSSFWIVRPRIEPGGVSGLDTLVGARYLSVLPGPEGSGSATHFVGLREEPMRTPPGSLELLLETTAAGGVGRGAPVTYRRLTVGRVLSIGLSGDSRLVEVRVAIDAEYAGLVLDNTRFFKTGGIDFSLGLAGLDLSIESLEAMISGGIGLATPEENAAPARTGKRYTLHSGPETEWLEWRPALAVGELGGISPRPVRARLTFEEGLLRRDQVLEAWTLWLDAGLLAPAELVGKPEGARDGAELEVSGITFPLTEPAEGAVAILAGAPPPAGAAPWPRARLSRAGIPSDCLAIGDPSLAPLALDAERLEGETLPWAIDGALPIDGTWHGAAVIERASGNLIGLLCVTEDGAWVEAIPEAYLP